MESVKRKSQKHLDDNFIDQKLAEAFGYQDEQLAEELDAITAGAGDDMPKGPGGELQKIMDRLDRGESRRTSRCRVARMRKMVKVLAAAAVLGAMVIGGGIWAGAKRYYTYDSRERSDLENVVVFNNNENNLIDDSESKEKESYRKIEEELNVEVLELSYVPEDFTFRSLTLWKSKAVVEYVGENSRVFLCQGCNDKSSSASYSSDMVELKKIYNKYLDIEIPVYQQELENGKKEYSIRIVQNNAYYILQGKIDEDEFVQIVYGLKKFVE